VQTFIAYSSRNWLTTSTTNTTAGSLTTGISYDSAGNITQYRLPDLSRNLFAYDNAHRLTSIRNNLNDKVAFTLDAARDVTQTLWQNSSSTTKRQHTATFDALGRMLTNVGGVSQTTTYSYDNNGNWVSITDPRGHISYRSSDALNRMTKFKDPVKNLTQIAYDSHSRFLTVTDPKNNATTYVYDGFGEPIQEINPDAGKTIFHYDADRNVSSKTDANGTVTNSTYDALDRPLTRTYPADSSQNVAFTYDQSGHGAGIGHLTSMTDPAGSLSRSYDQIGDLITDARTTGGHTYTTSYTFQAAGRLASVTYASSGWLATYSRDSAGQVSSITATQPGHSPVNIATSITHLPYGPISGFTYGNGVTDTRTYDLDYRLTAIKDTGTGGNIQYSSYGYDASNNVTSVTDHVTPGWTQGASYTNADQLSFASGPYGVVSTIKYDSGGNWTKYDTSTFTPQTTSNRINKINAASMAYDSAGHMTTGPSTSTMTYNKAGQQATATVFGSTGTNIYDGFGWRVTAQTGTGPTITQTYDQAGHYLERSAHDVSTDYVWLDGLPVAAIKPSTTAVISALHTNNLGAPVKATSAAQASVWTAYYAPCGVAGVSGATITQDLRYPGMVAVSGSNFLNNGYRDNLTQDCAYMEPDLIGQAGGTNRYTYAANNPLTNVDPRGLLPEPIELAVGAIMGGYAGYEAGKKAPTAMARAIDTAIGAGAGTAAAVLSPAASAFAGGGAVGALAFSGTAGVISVGATLPINKINGDSLFNDTGWAFLIGAGAPLLSGESLLIGSGYLEESLAAQQALSLNSGLFGVAGAYIDTQLHARLTPDNSLIQNRSITPGASCTVATPNLYPLYAPSY
jgi:RHS repeat-associated protein